MQKDFKWQLGESIFNVPQCAADVVVVGCSAPTAAAVSDLLCGATGSKSHPGAAQNKMRSTGDESTYANATPQRASCALRNFLSHHCFELLLVCVARRFVIEPAELGAFSYSVFEDRSAEMMERGRPVKHDSDENLVGMAGFQRVSGEILQPIEYKQQDGSPV